MWATHPSWGSSSTEATRSPACRTNRRPNGGCTDPISSPWWSSISVDRDIPAPGQTHGTRHSLSLRQRRQDRGPDPRLRTPVTAWHHARAAEGARVDAARLSRPLCAVRRRLLHGIRQARVRFRAHGEGGTGSAGRLHSTARGRATGHPARRTVPPGLGRRGGPLFPELAVCQHRWPDETIGTASHTQQPWSTTTACPSPERRLGREGRMRDCCQLRERGYT